MKVLVVHGDYGCDTGCCGHWIELRDDADRLVRNADFVFPHPDPWWPAPTGGSWLDLRWDGERGDDPPDLLRKWVERQVTETLGAKHVADLDWSRCWLSTE